MTTTSALSALGLLAFHLETKRSELEPKSHLSPILPLTTEVTRTWMSNCNLGIDLQLYQMYSIKKKQPQLRNRTADVVIAARA